MKTRRCASVAILILLMMSLTLSACGQGGGATSSSASKYGGGLVLRIAGEVTTFSVLHVSDTVMGVFKPWAIQGLIMRDPKSGEYIGQLATGWTISPNGLEWTFNLCKGVKWHDGAPFNADDVVFTAQLMQNPDVAAVYGSAMSINGKPIKFERIDDYKFKITLPEPYAPVLAGCISNLLPVPKHILEKIAPKDIAKSEWTQKPIYTGPFKFSEYKAGEYVKLVRFDDYWGGKPYLDSVLLRIIPDAEAALVALETGQIHSDTVAAKDFDRLKKAGELVTYQYPSYSVQNLCMNLDREPFTDIKVRQALSHLINRQAICDTVWKGFAAPMYSPMSPMYLYFSDAAQVKYDYNVDKARQLLAEAGFKPGKDGILEKNGKRLEFDALYRQGRAEDEQLLLIVQDGMAKAGVKMTPRAQEWSLMVKTITTMGQARDFDMMRMGHSMGPDPNSLAIIYDKSVAWAYTPSSDPRVTRLFAQGCVETDPNKRKAIYADLEKALGEDCTVLWIYNPQLLSADNRNVCYDEANKGLYGTQFTGKTYLIKK